MEKNKFELFINKHGISIFNEIKTMICKEKHTDTVTDNYLLYVFKIATCEFWGMNIGQSQFFIEENTPRIDLPNVSIEKIKIMHKNSIRRIQKCLKDATKNIKPN